MRILFKRFIAAVRKDSGGTALVTSLMFLIILTALGMASIMTASTELLVARNFRLNQLALDYANAGVNAAMQKLDSNAINTNVKAYDTIAPDYFPGNPDQEWHVNSTDLDIGSVNYSAKITYRKEDSLHRRFVLPPGNSLDDGVSDPPQVVAYSQDCGYTKSPMSSIAHAFPVYVIESTGSVKAGDKVIATSTVRTELAKDTIDLKAGSPVVSGACITMPAAAHVDGNDSCGTGANKVGMQTVGDCSPPNLDAVSGTTKFEKNADVVLDDMFGMPVDDIISQYCIPLPTAENANTMIELTSQLTATGETYGSAAAPLITYINNSGNELCKFNNCYGHGVLIVDGKLDMGGGFNWDGVVLVRGYLTISGAGSDSVNINGVIAATDGITLNGSNIDINYNQCQLDAIMDLAFDSKMINWKKVYSYDTHYE